MMGKSVVSHKDVRFSPDLFSLYSETSEMINAQPRRIPRNWRLGGEKHNVINLRCHYIDCRTCGKLAKIIRLSGRRKQRQRIEFEQQKKRQK